MGSVGREEELFGGDVEGGGGVLTPCTTVVV